MMERTISWPCRCVDCAPPLDSCDACEAPAGSVCFDGCCEHPENKTPCYAMSLVGRLSALAVLWRNLAAAGALCAAFDIGQTYGLWLADPYIPAHPSPWRSGCGRGVSP